MIEKLGRSLFLLSPLPASQPFSDVVYEFGLLTQHRPFEDLLVYPLFPINQLVFLQVIGDLQQEPIMKRNISLMAPFPVLPSKAQILLVNLQRGVQNRQLK